MDIESIIASAQGQGTTTQAPVYDGPEQTPFYTEPEQTPTGFVDLANYVELTPEQEIK